MPELVVDGVTGFYGDTPEELAEALALVDTLDPYAIRRHCERAFGHERMVSDYLAAYALAVGGVEPVALTA